MRRHKLLFLLGSMLLLLCTLIFTGASSPQAFAASATVRTTRTAVSPDTSCPPEIAYGSTGQWVRDLQDSLNTRYIADQFTNYPYNFYPYSEANAPLKADGIFGIDTENATKDYQTARGLEVDGIVGPQTWHELSWC